ncbi:MAG: PTS sugar transporter [Tenericutes bacterium]|nr:PTS sugar transporter [Mycoplasmatota bacterium]
MKKIAIVGSSGGNLYSLGGKNPNKLLGEILTQADSAGVKVSNIVFIGATSSMDSIKSTTKASLYEIFNGNLVNSELVSLKEANELAKEADKKLSEDIMAGLVDGIVVMSADAKGVNSLSLEAAAAKKLPITGTGGTSMAYIQALGAKVISASGTTGTTNRTRAIAALTSLSKFFGIKYHAVIKSSGSSDSKDNSSLLSRISIRGIMLASIPGFIAMALVLALSQIPFLSGMYGLFEILITALPVLVAVIAAKQVSGLDEVGIVAGIVAGVLSVDGGIIGGIIGGILAGVLAALFIEQAIKWKIPGTTSNIIAGGLAGLVAGLLVFYFIAPVALWAGDGIRWIIDAALQFSPALAGLLAGLLIWPAIMGGVYHAAILPIVLIEMEVEGMSFLGAVDMVGLVMVSAGITLANIVWPRRKDDRSIAAPGFAINMGFGTFVEAAYPFMFSNKLIMGTAILASGVGGLFVGLLGVKGTAYVPSVVAPALSNKPLAFVLCMLIALSVSFVLTMIVNRIGKKEVKVK